MFELEIAYVFQDYESRAEGLQNKVLGTGDCALFVYDAACRPRFHMRNVKSELWLSAVSGGKCVDSQLMKMDDRIYLVGEWTHLVVESRARIPLGSNVDIADGRLVVS